MSVLGWFNKMFVRNAENPSVPLSQAADLWGTSGTSSSGVVVNEQTALTYAAVWRAVNLISKDVAKLPIFVYQRDGAGKVRAEDHPAWALLRTNPNPFQNPFQFKMLLQSHALLRGNGYAWIVREGSGRPVELLPLDPAATVPVMERGRVHYETVVRGRTFRVDRDDMLHIRGLGDELEGFSVVRLARDSFGLGMAAQKYGAKFFENGARPSTVIKHPGTLKEGARDNLRRSWERLNAGVENAHRTAVLEEGMELQTFSMSNEDAQFLETRQFEVREIANWFGLPPHKLGDTSRTSFSSLEQENQAYLDQSIDPWLVTWESDVEDKLLTEDEKTRDTHSIEYERKALVRADLKTRFDGYASALQNGWMSRDEVRSRENLNPIPNGEGGTFFMPLNMDTTGNNANQVDDEPETDDGRSAFRTAASEMLLDAVSRMVARLMIQVKKSAKRGDDALSVFLRDMDEAHGSVVRGAITPAYRGFCAVEGRTFEDPTPILFANVREWFANAEDVEARAEDAKTKLAPVICGHILGTD